MGKLEKYSSYKDSDVEWLGEIPKHWEVQKMKYLGKIFAGLTDKKGDDFAKEISEDKKPFIPFTNICNNLKIDKNQMQYVKIKPYEKQNKVQKNDIIFLMSSETLEDIGKCSIYLDEEQLYLNSFCKGFRPKISTINPEYLNYLLQCKTYRNYFALVGRGFTRINIKQEYITDLFTLLPADNEQEKIASFLDKKTAQIDEAISQKEKLIELLKEKKQIVINDAVTKGLDKNVEFADSGIEWIEKIPKHWEVKKLKYIIKNRLKYGANESGILYDEELPRYVRITDFSESGKLSEKNKLSLSWEKGKDYLLKDGDVLFARSGATVGKTYQFKKTMSIEKNYAFAGYLIKAEANETIILSDYLYLYTNSNLFNRWKESIFNKATIENIGADKYSELFFTLPSIKEQKLILEDYFIKSTKIDKIIELQQNYISKLKEYKASLIDSVVTGKVKVS